ncbi:hypothetical protein [Nocardioides kribbensis]|uniref:C2H2-type domain-containing protein n=1 Tax=Nocardioides kribbensis TaxID=305517 RepID=A0ABV1NZ59_9ACTN
MPDIDPGTYDCRECGEEINADADPSRCEGHHVCHHCSQWCPCAVDRAEEIEMDEMRGVA